MNAPASYLQELASQLETSEAPAREAAMIALADFGHLSSVRGLLRQRAEVEPEPELRFRARKLWGRLEQLFPRTGHPLVVAFAGVCAAEGSFDRAEFRRLVDHPEDAVRLGAAMLAVQLDRSEALPAIVDRAGIEEDPWVLAALIVAIGRFGALANVGALTDCLRHRSPRVVANSIEALYRISPADAFVVSAPLLASQDNRVRANAVMVLRARDPENFENHVRLMASSSRESFRASALYCARQLAPEKAHDLVLDMFAKESLQSEAQAQSRMLAELAVPEDLPGLVALGEQRASHQRMVRSILESMARRLGWTAEELEARIADARQRIEPEPLREQGPPESEREQVAALFPADARRSGSWVLPRKEALSKEQQRRNSGVFPSESHRTGSWGLPQRTSGVRSGAKITAVVPSDPVPDGQPHRRVVLAGLLAVTIGVWAVRTRSAGEDAQAASTRPGPSALRPEPARRSALRPAGPVAAVSGRVVSAEGGSLVLRNGYDSYVVHFEQAAPPARVQVGQELEVKASSRRWDAGAGATVLMGISASAAGPSGRVDAGEDAPSYGEWVAASPAPESGELTGAGASTASSEPVTGPYDPNAKVSHELLKRLDPNLARLLGIDRQRLAAAP